MKQPICGVLKSDTDLIDLRLGFFKARRRYGHGSDLLKRRVERMPSWRDRVVDRKAQANVI